MRGVSARVRRGKEIVSESTISSLRRFKDDVKEVTNGYECGVGIKDFDEFQVGDILEFFRKEKKKYVASEWEVGVGRGLMIINFEDGSKATVFASDTVLGGVRNVLNVYLSNAVVYVNINPHDVLEVYAPEPHILGEEYIAEKLETKAGWNFPSPDDDWMKGFPQELEDFIDAIRYDREPVSGMDLARDVVEAIYAGYTSAERGERIEFKR